MLYIILISISYILVAINNLSKCKFSLVIIVDNQSINANLVLFFKAKEELAVFIKQGFRSVKLQLFACSKAQFWQHDCYYKKRCW